MLLILQSYERRGSVVRPGKESELWESITAEMMSEEEEHGDSYIRHQPSYRSKAFSKFIDKLDKRLYSKLSKHPRLERSLGSPQNRAAPDHCKKWMVRAANDEDQESSGSNDGTASDTELA